MRINNINYIPTIKTSQIKRQESPDNVQQTPEYATNSIDYSQIAFGAIYGVKNKKISLEVEKGKLLKQINDILNTMIQDTDPEDRIFAAITKALNQFKAIVEKEKQLTEELEKLFYNTRLNTQQRVERANQLRSEFNRCRKKPITVDLSPPGKEDERYDYPLISRFKMALENGDFNLKKVVGEYYADLKEIKTIEELTEKHPKIKIPKRPEEVISNKIISTLTRDFFEAMEEADKNNNLNQLTAVIERKIKEISKDTAKKYSLDSEQFAERIVISVTEAIWNKYSYIKENNAFSQIPIVRKNTNPINETDVKMLYTDFDDFVLTVIRKHYLDGEKLNSITYGEGKNAIKVKSLSSSEYKFDKMSEKVKGIINDSEELFRLQRDYEHYDVDEFKKRIAHYSEEEIAKNEHIFSQIFEFGTSSFTGEDIGILTKFLRQLDNIADGKISQKEGIRQIVEENLRPKGTLKLNELEKRKAEALAKAEQKQALQFKFFKKSFNDAINLLYEYNLNNIASTCAKYEPKSLAPEEIQRAESLIKIIKTHMPKGQSRSVNKHLLETEIRRWDTFMSYKNSCPNSPQFKHALKYATNPDGTVDILKAGQYLINRELVELYPESLQFSRNPEVFSSIMSANPSDATVYMCKYDNYKDLVSKDNNAYSLYKKIFDIKDPVDKNILKIIIENDYVTSSTTRLTVLNSAGDTTESTITPSAKKLLLDKYDFPKCLKYYAAFEEAMTKLAKKEGESGIKIFGSTNKASKYGMEIKIMGEDDRLAALRGKDYLFEDYSPTGFH